MVIDPQTLQGPVGALGAAERVAADGVPAAWAEQYFRRAAVRFKERSARIQLAADVRHENIVVPIPDGLIGDDEIDFVTYIDPSRKTIESGWKQALAENPPLLERPPISGTDTDEAAADMVETVAGALQQTIVNWDALVGKGIEDGEVGLTIQYDLEDYLSAPLPREELTERAWKKLPKREREDGWTRVEPSSHRVTYRRYRQRYWRDDKGRAPSDGYYRRRDGGTTRTFERDLAATERAWRDASKAWQAGEIPLTVRLVPAINCAPLLIAGTKAERWACRGLAIRELYSIDDLVSQGYAWTGLGTPLYPIAYDGTSGARQVWVYQVHCWLEAENDDGEIEQHPCIVTSVDGRHTTQWSAEDGDYCPAVLDLKQTYGVDVLPANYFHFAHTEADDPDGYAYPAMYPLLSAIMNREGTLSAYQSHLRKFALGKLAVTPNPDLPKESWLSADGAMKPLDLAADVVLLPGPVGPLAQPPAPNAVRDLLGIYSHDIEQNSPGSQTRGAGDSTASGHSLNLQEGFFLSANRHVLEAARKAVEWIVSTALRMLAALEETFKVQASVFVREQPPADAQPRRRRGQAIAIESKWFKENYTLVAKYAKVGNLAEIQQLAELKAQGLASFADVMEARGKTSVMNERVEIGTDRFWDGPGKQLLDLMALKERGDMERAAILEAQMNKQLQPGGLPTDAIPPEVAALGQQGGPPGQPPGPGQQMTGTALPNIAASQLGGITAGAIGAGAQLHDAQALAQAGLPGGGGGV